MAINPRSTSFWRLWEIDLGEKTRLGLELRLRYPIMGFTPSGALINPTIGLADDDQENLKLS
jgi:hypothetical protein